MGKLRIISNNIIWITAERGFRITLLSVISIVIARELGPSFFGDFSFSFSVISLSYIFISLGLNSILIKEFKERSKSHVNIFASFLIVRLSLALLISVFLLTFSYNTYLLLLLPLLFVKSFDILEARFQSFDDNKTLAKGSFLGIIVFVLCTSLVLFNILEKEYICLAYVLDSLIYMTYLLYNSSFKFQIKLESKKYIVKILKLSFPILLLSFAGIINQRLDQVFLGYYVIPSDLGQYSIATKITDMIMIFPAIIGISIYPSLIDLQQIDYSKFKRVIKIISLGGFFFSVIIVAFTLGLSEKFINLFLGTEYYETDAYLNRYVLSIIPTFTTFIFSYVFMIKAKTDSILYVALFAIILNIILNAFLIPELKINGAIYATVISSILTSVFILIIYIKDND